MAQPVAYAPVTSFIGYQAQQPWFPGQNIDIELAAIKATTDQVRANLALIQRDDGALANGVVTYLSLSPTLQTSGLAPLSVWATGTAYTVPQAIMNGTSLYQCAIAHTSGTFATDLAAGDWTLLANLSVFSPVATVAANLVAAGPTSGAAVAPTFRSLIGTDLPNPAAATLGGVNSKAAVLHQFLTSIGTNGAIGQAQPAFSDISGTAAASQLPTPGVATLGGVNSKAAVASNFLTSIGTDGSVTQAQPAFTDISGSVAAAQLPNPAAATLGGVKSKAAVTSNFLTSIGTDGSVGQAQPASGDISGLTSYATAAVGQLPGTTTNDNAAAGKIGEYISSTVLVGSAVALTTNTDANVTSISLTAGDWDVTVNAYFTGTGTTTVSFLAASMSTTSAVRDTSPGRLAQLSYNTGTTTFSGGAVVSCVVGPTRFSLSGTTTVFFTGTAAFGASTCSAFGIIRARRVR